MSHALALIFVLAACGGATGDDQREGNSTTTLVPSLGEALAYVRSDGVGSIHKVVTASLNGHDLWIMQERIGYSLPEELLDRSVWLNSDLADTELPAETLEDPDLLTVQSADGLFRRIRPAAGDCDWLSVPAEKAHGLDLSAGAALDNFQPLDALEDNLSDAKVASDDRRAAVYELPMPILDALGRLPTLLNQPGAAERLAETTAEARVHLDEHGLLSHVEVDASAALEYVPGTSATDHLSVRWEFDLGSGPYHRPPTRLPPHCSE